MQKLNTYSVSPAIPLLKHCSTLFVLAGLALSIGCTDSNDTRGVQLNGEVTLNGQPIKVGRISFTPDVKAGNRGPMGTCRIKDGKYDTTAFAGRGVTGGPHVVKIENYCPPSENAPAGGEGSVSPADFERHERANPIKGGYSENWDIPTGDSPITKDFNIEK